MSYTYTSIYFKDYFLVQLEINVQAGYSGIFRNVGGSLENNYKFEDPSIKTRSLVKFMQVYYSCDIDPLSKPADLFADSVP